MLACDVMLANQSKFKEQGTMSNAHAVLQQLGPELKRDGLSYVVCYLVLPSLLLFPGVRDQFLPPVGPVPGGC